MIKFYGWFGFFVFALILLFIFLAGYIAGGVAAQEKAKKGCFDNFLND